MPLFSSQGHFDFAYAVGFLNSPVDENGVKHVPVDIHFTAVGIINIPDTEEILQIMEEIRTKPLRIA